MASQTMFKDLPFDTIVEIGKYLSPMDVNHCCAVSHAWRHTFNQNPFWKKHCNKDVVTYLKSTQCEGQDIRTEIEENPDVARMSEWRVNYVYQNQLRKNWIDGRYSQNKLFNVRRRGADNDSFEFYDNDFLFLITEKSVLIYNTSESSINFIRQVSYNLPYDFHKITLFFHKTSNEKFCITQNNLVKVFDISLTHNWPVSFIFLFDKTEEESSVGTESPNVRDYLSRELCTQNCMEIINGDIYVCIVRTRDLLEQHVVLMHIWNIKTKRKLKVETVPIAIDEHIVSVFMSNSETLSDNILIECSIRLPNRIDNEIIFKSHYFVYNLATLKYYPLQVFSTYPLGFHVGAILHDCLYVMHREGLALYDYNERCHVIRRYPYSGIINMTLTGDSMATFNSVKEIKILKLRSGDIEMFNRNLILKWSHKLWDKFVMFDNGSSLGHSSLWYLGEQSKRIFDRKGKYLCYNKSGTRLLIDFNETLYLLSFW